MQKVLSRVPDQLASDTSREVSDEELIARIAAGDRRALGMLYARHHVRLHHFLVRLTDNAASAEDLVSDVFLDIWKQADRFEGRSQVSTWMLGITRHKAISALRRRRTEPLNDEIAEGIVDGSSDPEVALQEQETVHTVRQALSQLSAAHREIVDLVYYHGRSISEVAEIVGVPEATVKTRMFYARKRLAGLLEGQRLAA